MDYFLHSLVDAAGLIFTLNTEVYSIVLTSIGITLVAVILASISGIPLAFLIAFKAFPGRSLLLHILNTLMALPTVVVGLFLYGLLTRQGPLGDMGLLYTPLAIIIGQWLLILPIMVNLTITAVQSADPRLIQTCQSLGANTLQQAFLFLSELRFGIMSAIVTGFGRAIGEVGVAMMLGGNIAGYTRTMTTAIALETSKGEFEFALALGLLLLIVAFIIYGLMQRLQQVQR